MRRIFPILLLGLAAIGLGGGGQQAPQRMIEFSAADRAELDRVSAYLNSIRTMQGSFLQIGPNGEVDRGDFYLAKPGRVRFAYRPPSPTLIVADGKSVAVANLQLNTVDRYALSDTPLDLILGDSIDLRHNRAVIGVEYQEGSLVIQGRSSNNRTQANISLVFTEPELELRQWTILDNQGLSTTLALRDVQTGVVLPDSLFAIPSKRPPAGKPGD